MLITDVKRLGSNKVRVVQYRNGHVEKMLTISEGDELVVQPDNPLKKKHRGRTCKVVRFEKTYESRLQAIVLFHDTKRQGKVDIEDLATV